MVEKENQKLVPTCCEGVPRKSSLVLCSRTQTTNPIKNKKHKLVSQRSRVNGFRKAQAFVLLSSVVGTIMVTRPDFIYGRVKSTYKDLLATIDMSPTAASYSC